MVDYADLLAARYESQGRGPNYDCWGLVQECLKRQGFDVPTLRTPTTVQWKDKLYQDLAEKWVVVPRETPGCVVAFKLLPPFVTHVGIVIGSGTRFLHIAENMETPCVERLDDVYWRYRIAGFYLPK